MLIMVDTNDFEGNDMLTRYKRVRDEGARSAGLDSKYVGSWIEPSIAVAAN